MKRLIPDTTMQPYHTLVGPITIGQHHPHVTGLYLQARILRLCYLTAG